MTKYELRTQLAANTAALRKEDPDVIVRLFQRADADGVALFGLCKTLGVSYWTVTDWKRKGWSRHSPKARKD